MRNQQRDKIREQIAKEKRHWVRLTKTCNLNCLFCLDKENQNGEIVPIRKIYEDLKKGRGESATRAILSGGEPTLHPQLLKIIKKAKKLGYNHVQIITNGRMLSYKKFAEKLKNAGLDEITFSLHSHLKGPFEEMTQTTGSYLQSIKGLLNALEQKFIISVDIVINKINYKTLKDTLNFFIKLGVTEFDLLHIVPFGNSWLNKDKIFLSPIKSQKFLNAAFALSKNKNLFIWTNRLPATYLEGYEELIQSPIKLHDEIQGKEPGFKDYIQNNHTMSCFGERCSYCFIQDFCKDLVELKNNKILKSKNTPPCLSKKNKHPKTIFKFKKNMNLYQFLDFYINHRYFVKSIRCGKCCHFERCDGEHINLIRTQGFRVLKPE
ncbi:MAG: radical SAM protein [Candidatus Omnitrophica bacterium]|nr:radical SAM protein [Candidatus Omnitrophota bacterium]